MRFGLDVVSVGSVSRCGKCGLCKECNTPGMKPTGKGRKGIMVIAEAPGRQEDEQGVQLVGRAGRFFRSVLNEFGVDLDRDCWKTNAVCCRPPRNRKPTNMEIQACRPNVFAAIRQYQPKVILLLGQAAVESVIGQDWGESVGPIGRWVGFCIPSIAHNAWICPTWHPSYLLRDDSEPLHLWFRKHIERALSFKRRPWRKPPDYTSLVDRVIEPTEAAKRLAKLRSQGQSVSFDYETDRLKPDHGESRIVTCAVSNGKRAMAFPWLEPAVSEMSKLLRSDVPKIGWNIKYEERWTRKVLGHGVRRWAWDGMLATHVLDNRPGITSLKFQSYIWFGQPLYDKEVAPYLDATRGNEQNRIRKIPLLSLLLYNGLDALFTHMIAYKQRQQMMQDVSND